MKPIAISLLAGLLPCVAVYAAPAPQALVDEAKTISQGFMESLKGELQRAMKAGGPVAAVEVCHSVAPAIAGQQAKEHGWDKVARTSLKLRNPADAPDAWEKGVLEQFEARKAAGEPAGSLSYSEVVETEGGKEFRFMKAIPTGKLCLACHGTEIADPVAAKLDELYPEDQARGFQEGDIRGAFTLVKKL